MKKVKDTSKDCYKNVVKYTKNKDYKIILDFLYTHKEGFTNRELAQHTKIITSTMSARINELLEAGYIERINKRKCRITNITAYEVSLTKEGIKYCNKLKKVKILHNKIKNEIKSIKNIL